MSFASSTSSFDDVSLICTESFSSIISEKRPIENLDLVAAISFFSLNLGLDNFELATVEAIRLALPVMETISSTLSLIVNLSPSECSHCSFLVQPFHESDDIKFEIPSFFNSISSFLFRVEKARSGDEGKQTTGNWEKLKTHHECKHLQILAHACWKLFNIFAKNSPFFTAKTKHRELCLSKPLNLFFVLLVNINKVIDFTRNALSPLLKWNESRPSSPVALILVELNSTCSFFCSFLCMACRAPTLKEHNEIKWVFHASTGIVNSDWKGEHKFFENIEKSILIFTNKYIQGEPIEEIRNCQELTKETDVTFSFRLVCSIEKKELNQKATVLADEKLFLIMSKCFLLFSYLRNKGDFDFDFNSSQRSIFLFLAVRFPLCHWASCLFFVFSVFQTDIDYPGFFFFSLSRFSLVDNLSSRVFVQTNTCDACNYFSVTFPLQFTAEWTIDTHSQLMENEICEWNAFPPADRAMNLCQTCRSAKVRFDRELILLAGVCSLNVCSDEMFLSCLKKDMENGDLDFFISQKYADDNGFFPQMGFV